jgi:5-methylcytosine-specific restriction endonuclease McrA
LTPKKFTNIYIRDCDVCGETYVGRNKASKQCGRHTASEQITARYHHDPEFRDQVLARAHMRRGSGEEDISLAYLIERDRRRCGICGRPVKATRGPMRPSIDHIIPLSKGGKHELANVQLSHYRCNLSKNNRGGGEQLALIG